MKILALEFSSSQRSAAVVLGAARPEIVTEVVETGGPPTRPFAMIEEALRQAGIEREQVECVAVGLGPGSYTGIRAAISIAQGWQLAGGTTQLLGISSVDCLLEQARESGMLGRLNIVIDAQRKEFYLAQFELAAAKTSVRHALRLASLADVQERLRAGEKIAGPDLPRYFPEAIDLFPRAAVLGQLALSRTEFVPGEQLAPIYLRETSFVKAPPPRVIPGP
jgi:tRNA threonylcarbamoyl adenosine modification protein YeaZ